DFVVAFTPLTPPRAYPLLVPGDNLQVAICVRTKDFARFLPEWIAFHYVLGVDEIGVYDDDSTDNTREVLQPFVDAGIVNY
ncbi:unnamed protein product, partial [Hapterophycus canaliculatus]